MTAITNGEMEPPEPAEQPRRPAYDPHNLAPEDEESREFDDSSEEIDWDEIIATTQGDFLAGRYAYNSADYATQEKADIALDEWLVGILERVEREIKAVPSRDAEG